MGSTAYVHFLLFTLLLCFTILTESFLVFPVYVSSVANTLDQFGFVATIRFLKTVKMGVIHCQCRIRLTFQIFVIFFPSLVRAFPHSSKSARDTFPEI